MSTPAAGDTKLVDSMTEIRADVFAGRIDPGDIKIIRTIEAGSAGTDTAVFSGPRADYDITPNINGTLMTIAHARGRHRRHRHGAQCGDLRFSDQQFHRSSAILAQPDVCASSSTPRPAQTVTLSNTGNAPLASRASRCRLAGTNPGDY